MNSHRSIVALLLLAPFLWLSAGASASSPDAATESDSITIETLQLSEGRFLLSIDSEATDAAAILVTTPQSENPLVLVELDGWVERDDSIWGGAKPLARVTVSGDDLRGHMEHILAYDAEGLHELTVSLLTKDGSLRRGTIRSVGLARGEAHEVELEPASMSKPASARGEAP
ncbi:MAG: hypothetical protein KDD11_00470 [Acidobacteria bacterium]|nr:hypothetical protein [Acidobacteriota bacterium]